MRNDYKHSLEFKSLIRLKKTRSNIILRKEFDSLGSRSQMTRIFKKFIDKKILVKVSFGIYAKAYISKYTKTPLIKGGIDEAFYNTLKKLNVQFEPGSAEKEYAAGLTTQIPAKNIVRLKSRCRRQIGYKNIRLIYEKNINAK